MTERTIKREGPIYTACAAKLAEYPGFASLTEVERMDATDRAWLLAEHHPVSYAVAQVAATLPVKTVRVAGEMQSGFDGAGAFYSRVEGVTLNCYADGSVRWSP